MNNIARDLGSRIMVAVGISYLGFAASFASSIVVARALGVAGKGTFSLFMATVAGLSLFAGLGIGHGQMYHAARRRENLKHFLPNALLVSVLVGGGVGAAYFLLGRFFDVSIVMLLGWPGILAGIVAVPALSMLIFQRQYLLTVGSLILAKVNGAVKNIIPLVALGILYAFGRISVGGLILAVVAGHLVLYLVFRAGVRRYVDHAPSFSRAFARDSFTFGFRHYLSNLAQYLTFRLDFFLVAWLLGDAGLGLYSVAAVLAEIAAQIPREVGTLLFPALASGSLTGGRATAILRSTVALAVVIAVVSALLSEPIVLFLYGPDFREAVPVFRWVLPGTVAWSTIAITWTHTSASGRPGTGVWVFGAAAALDALLVIVLVPRLGLEGAAVAATASYWLSALLFLRIFCRSEHCSWSEALLLRRSDVRQIVRQIAAVPHLLRRASSEAR